MGGVARSGPSLGDRFVYLLGVFGLAASITAVWLGMRAVMGIGGACASGGAYEIATPCPDGVDLVMFLAFPLGFLCAGVIVWKGVRLGGGWTGVAALAWPALFLSLGWNFLESGIAPPDGGGPGVGFLIPGVIFMLMGGIPLVVWIRARGDAPIVPGVPGTRARSDVRELRDLRNAMANAARLARANAGPSAATMGVYQATHATPPVTPMPDASTPVDVDQGEVLVSRLERLAQLHGQGALSSEEFQAAKAALLAGARATDR